MTVVNSLVLEFPVIPGNKRYLNFLSIGIFSQEIHQFFQVGLGRHYRKLEHRWEDSFSENGYGDLKFLILPLRVLLHIVDVIMTRCCVSKS